MQLIVISDLVWEYLQLYNQISTILITLTTMIQLLNLHPITQIAFKFIFIHEYFDMSH